MILIPVSSVLADYSVVTDFPGGNAQVEVSGDTVSIKPDLRDTPTAWFYWYVAVKGAEGKKLTFEVDPKFIGARGPGVSVDGGKTWKWMGLDTVKIEETEGQGGKVEKEGTFSYTFGPQDKDVRFSVGMPYVPEDLTRFLSAYKDNPFVQQKVLTKSRKDRDVPLLIFSNPDRKAPYAVAITARNHACEMMGSYVLEGIMEGILADDAQGKWLRDNVDFFIVPFADYDGVEDGDQGKNRGPHDHNRDYGEETIYPEVAAIKQQLPVWSAGRPLVFFDLHDPALKGEYFETLFFLENLKESLNAPLERFMTLLDKDSQGLIRANPNMIMKHGTGYNRKTSEDGPPLHASGWAGQLPNAILASTMELAYATAGGFEVNAESARELGRDMAWALAAFLQESPKPQ